MDGPLGGDKHLTMFENNFLAALKHFASASHGRVHTTATASFVSCPLPFDGPLFNAVLPTVETPGSIVLNEAREFFSGRRRPYHVWTCVGRDTDLEEAALSAGFVRNGAGEGPAMVLSRSVEPLKPPEGVGIVQVHDSKKSYEFGLVAASAFALGAKRDVAEAFSKYSWILTSPTSFAFVAVRDGRSVACSLLLRTGHVAGLYFVGTTPTFRRQGLGTLLSAYAVYAGFSSGVDVVFLQSSLQAVSLYQSLGFSEFAYFRCFSSISREGLVGPCG